MEKNDLLQTWRQNLTSHAIAFVDETSELLVTLEEKDENEKVTKKLELTFFITEQDCVEATFLGYTIYIRDGVTPELAFKYFLLEKTEYFPDR